MEEIDERAIFGTLQNVFRGWLVGSGDHGQGVEAAKHMALMALAVGRWCPAKQAVWVCTGSHQRPTSGAIGGEAIRGRLYAAMPC